MYIKYHVYWCHLCGNVQVHLNEDIYIVGWLFHKNENKDQEIAGTNINIHTLSMAIDVLVCITVEDIRNAMS